jgi:PST family polysaccharide transporter
MQLPTWTSLSINSTILINRIKNISNTEDKKRLLSNFFSLSVLQAFTYLLPLLTLPYLVRVLGVEKFGLVMFAQTFITFFAIFVDYGFNLSSTREVSIHREDKVKLTEIFSSVMMIKCILLGVSLIVLSVIVFSFEKFSSESELYYLSFLMLIGQALFPTWYFQGLERMKYTTLVNITSKLFFTIAIFVFIQNEEDYILVPIISGLGFIVGGVYSLYILKQNFSQKFELQSIQTLSVHFKDSSQFFLSRLSSAGYSNANIFLAGVLLSPSFVTYYYLADKAVNVILSLFDPIVQTIYPHLSKKYSFSFLFKLLICVMSASVIIVMVGYMAGDLISIILLDEINNTFINLFNIIILIIPISILYVMLGAPLLLARGYKKEFNFSIIYGFFVHLVILSVLSFYYKINSNMNSEILIFFASSVVFSKFIVLLIRIYYVCKNKLYK